MVISKPCPNCKNQLPSSRLRDYLKDGELQCPYCCKTLGVRFRHELMASAIIGALVGGLLTLLTNLDFIYVAILTAMLGMFLVRYVELALFPLTVKDDANFF